MISSGKIYNTDKPNYAKKDKDSDYSSNSSTNSNIIKRDSFEVRKVIEDKLAKYDIKKELNLTDKAMSTLEMVQEYEFDVFTLERETNGNEMIALTTYLLQKHDMYVDLAIDPDTFNRFVSTIQNGYCDVAYHNKIHGTDVGRLAYYYSTHGDLMDKASLTDVDLFTMIIGGIAHDYEHKGWNNGFLVETSHDWALTYSDISVCENHHVAATFEVIKKVQGCNIFEHFNRDDYKYIRKNMTKAIIATDMAHHFEHIDK
jgi:calcium/calmodulin-dependent 3',5'-cyclic nucleotide phosphodiesterase